MLPCFPEWLHSLCVSQFQSRPKLISHHGVHLVKVGSGNELHSVNFHEERVGGLRALCIRDNFLHKNNTVNNFQNDSIGEIY